MPDTAVSYRSLITLISGVTLTSEPAAAQSIRLLLGLAIQKVEVALKYNVVGGRKGASLF